MKLRNKKTGEITSDISFIPADENRVAVDEGFRVIDTLYSSIADLCEEWEDYQGDKPWKPKYYKGRHTDDEYQEFRTEVIGPFPPPKGSCWEYTTSPEYFAKVMEEKEARNE